MMQTTLDEHKQQETAISEENLTAFLRYLHESEKAPATISKYEREVRKLMRFLDGKAPKREHLILYRDSLKQEKGARSVNASLSAVNAYLQFQGMQDRKLHLLRVQRSNFVEEQRELSEEEYRKLLHAARMEGNERLWLLLQTVCSSGIRISELPFITVEAAGRRWAEISMKGKERRVLLQQKLCEQLLRYARKESIETGSIFLTCHGNPMNRSNIWQEMKRLCRLAGVDEKKGYPHNLRHLFARSFYQIEKDLAHLADILGHSSIETTRIYVAQSMKESEKLLCRMQLLERME